MHGISTIIYYFFVRFGGAMHFSLFILFMLGIFGIADFWHKKKALLWCAAAVIGTFAWRIMWLGSLNGRGTRYYVFSAIVAIFLLPLGIRGVTRLLDRFCRPNAVYLWTAFIVFTLMANLGPELAPKDSKVFLAHISTDIEKFHEENPGKTTFLDGTCERSRLKFPMGVAVVDVGRIRLEKYPRSDEPLLALLKNDSGRYGQKLLLLRQPQDHSTEAKLLQKMKLKRISEYPFRKNLYTLYLIEQVL